MKKLLSLLFVLGLALSACGTSPTQSALPTRTYTPSLVSTATSSSTATQTPIPPTSTVTPLPTIPTFTPTFDASAIVTVTPAEKVECPKENVNIKPTFQLPDSFSCSINGGAMEECFPKGLDEIFLGYLNSGGSIDALLNLYISSAPAEERQYFYQDVTGDSVPELMLYDLSFFSEPLFYYCEGGEYKLFDVNYYDYTDYKVKFISIRDLNKNNLPEIIFTIKGCWDNGCFGVSSFEWGGKTFIDRSPTTEMWGVKNFELIDVDHNGTTEIILTGSHPGMGTYIENIPWRYETKIYSWNGKAFTLASMHFDMPEYRFQAIQDADTNVLVRHFTEAFAFYKDAIFSKELSWWSEEREEYEKQLFLVSFDPTKPTPQPEPPEDLTEYPRLAAYAYYRIMLLHLVQGGEAEAASTYQTLYETFGNDPYAAPYVEMASAFWKSYQSTHKMYDGCAAAIQYAVEHPEILVPLGSDYHGWQSHIYVPADVCPFR